MPTFTWWIDEPVLKGSANPTDEDLAELRAQGFATALSLLEEDKQPARHDKASTKAAGWSIDSIPVEESSAPSLDQIREFANRLQGMPPGTKVVVFCESGLGRTAFMGAVYWIMKGYTARMRLLTSTRHPERLTGQLKNGSGFSLNTSGR